MSPEKTCAVCNRRYSFGCGHTREQEAAARVHEKTAAHQTGNCMHYGHNRCDPLKCEFAGKSVPGYAPFVEHTDVEK